MKSNSNRSAQLKPLTEIWQAFVQQELKSKSTLGELLQSAEFGEYDGKARSLSLYFADDEIRKKVQGKRDVLQKKLGAFSSRLLCDRISFKTGTAPVQIISSSVSTELGVEDDYRTDSPLQALWWVEPNLPTQYDAAPRMKILRAAVAADKTNQPLYTKLTDRTRVLAGQPEHVIEVTFDWRVRVGGTRGFRELLLPVLHPVFGIPYIPAASLKGATRAWARKTNPSKVDEYLGTLDQGIGAVEFLDAFPIAPFLSIDVATPQWHWRTENGDYRVEFDPDPHPLLSLKQPTFLVGMRLSSRGASTSSDAIHHVKDWLQQALAMGIGSRVSSGYGRCIPLTSSHSQQRIFPFKLYTQGMYGANPPSKGNKGTPEFRPTAVRGVLRYWFRAIALGLYSPQVCQQWEGELFGDLGQQGRITIGAPSKLKSNQDVYCYEGTLLLEAQDTEALQLAEAILKVAYGLGGLGRGCRRPLHRVNQRMRGCHWELNDISMPFEPSVWTDLIDAARQVCRALKPSSQEYTCPPGRPRERRQDVLDRHAMVWLVESSDMLRFDPAQVNWAKDGHQESVRGCALTLLYSSDQFKGKSTDQPGNPCVGGAMPGGGIGTPSYVWIRSMFPANQQPYQVVTIFGANHPDRQAFAQAIQNTGGVLAWGNAIG